MKSMRKLDNVLLLPLGEIDPGLAEYLKNGLCERLKCNVEIGMPEPSPMYAYDKHRRQYRSSMILDRMRSTVSDDAVVLGVVDADMYMPGLNFVFGEAEVAGRVAVISLGRLVQAYHGLPPDYSVVRARALKEAVHELGHVAGLNHCDSERCVMYFSSDIEATDVKESKFCTKCLGLIPQTR